MHQKYSCDKTGQSSNVVNRPNVILLAIPTYPYLGTWSTENFIPQMQQLVMQNIQKYKFISMFIFTISNSCVPKPTLSFTIAFW